MKLSTRAHYGLRAVVAIAKLSRDGEPVSVMDIAKLEGLSDTYLEQLMSKLRRAGVLKSYRGARGGYQLDKDPDEISVAEVLEAAGEKIIFPDCTEEEGCLRARQNGCLCPSGYFWTQLSAIVEDLAQKTTVGALLRQAEEALQENEGVPQKDPLI